MLSNKSLCAGISVFTVLLILVAQAPAETRTWTGAVDYNWTTSGNWSPAGTPATSDDLTVSSGSANATDAFATDGGSIVISNTGSLTAGEFVAYGGTVSVLNGGTVTAGNAYAGDTATDSGLFTVSGSGSSVVIDSQYGGDGALAAGERGSGYINIADGASLTCQRLALGFDGGSGYVTVDGTGSQGGF